MHRSLSLLLITISFFATTMAHSASGDEDETQAREAIENFVVAFNSEDHETLASLMHYPHIFLADTELYVDEEPHETNFDQLREKEDWKSSTLDSAISVFALPNKIHMLVRFTRYNFKGESYSTFEGIWIMTKKKGRWGVSVRSY